MPRTRKRLRFGPRVIVPVRSDVARSLLTERQRLALEGNQPARQRFKSTLKRLAHNRLDRGERWSKGRLRVVAQAAAGAVLKEPLSRQGRRRSKQPVMKKGMVLFHLNPVHLFPSGARTRFKALQTPKIYGFDVLGPFGHVMVKPSLFKRQREEIRKALERYDKERDEFESLKGSIGYMSLSMHRVPGASKPHERPTLVVWNVQPRAMPETPAWFRRLYKGWELQLLEYIEKVSWKAGAGRVAVISPEHVKEMKIAVENRPFKTFEERRESKREKISKYYERLAEKLSKHGYHLKNIGELLDPSVPKTLRKIPFLVRGP